MHAQCSGSSQEGLKEPPKMAEISGFLGHRALHLEQAPRKSTLKWSFVVSITIPSTLLLFRTSMLVILGIHGDQGHHNAWTVTWDKETLKNRLDHNLSVMTYWVLLTTCCVHAAQHSKICL